MNEQMQMPKDPKESEAMVKPWMDWLGGLAKKGNLVDALPTQMSGKEVTKAGVKDYKAQKIDLGGYAIIKANSLDEAVKIAQSSPQAKMGLGTTIVRECMEM